MQVAEARHEARLAQQNERDQKLLAEKRVLEMYGATLADSKLLGQNADDRRRALEYGLLHDQQYQDALSSLLAHDNALEQALAAWELYREQQHDRRYDVLARLADAGLVADTGDGSRSERLAVAVERLVDSVLPQVFSGLRDALRSAR